MIKMMIELNKYYYLDFTINTIVSSTNKKKEMKYLKDFNQMKKYIYYFQLEY
jgi:hypothetical protein